MRRIGLEPATIIQQVQDFIREKEITTDSVVTRSYATDDAPASKSSESPIQLRAESLANSGQFDWICAGWINNLYREISIGLADRRVDLATAIATLRLLQQHAAQLNDFAFDGSDQSGDKQKRLSRSEREFARRSVSAIVAVQLEHFASSVKFFEERLDRFSMILAIAITESSKARREEDPWSSMPPEIASHLPELKHRLHDLSVNAYLVRPLNDHGSNVDAQFLMSEISRHAADLVIPIVKQHNELLVVKSGGTPKKTLEVSISSKTPNDLAIRRAVDATQSMPGANAAPEESSLTVEEAVELARPAMLSLGGLQRLILVVSNEIERGRMEAELRAVFDGPLTVAVIPGSDPKLIHEAQQIELKNVLSRLSALNGGLEQITAKLSSRTDVQW
jgi:hypothetical protein